MDRYCVDLLGTRESPSLAEALAPQLGSSPADASAQLGDLPTHVATATRSPLPQVVAGHAGVDVEIEHQRDGKDVIFPGDRDKLLPRRWLDIGRIDHGETSRLQPLAQDEPQCVKCGAAAFLVALVIGYHSPEHVG